MNKEKMTALMVDQEAAAEIAACKTLKDIVDCMNKHGAECTMVEDAAFVMAMKSQLSKSEAMDLDAMDAVAGGNIFSDVGDWLIDKFGLNMDYLTHPADPFDNWNPPVNNDNWNSPVDNTWNIINNLDPSAVHVVTGPAAPAFQTIIDQLNRNM